MMVVLKLPILALFGIIWWAIKQTPEEAAKSIQTQLDELNNAG